ncbi:MAG: ATP-binding protein, partial [Verrucomicrobia bacterium]|nr:ATP-binding protein [Verrucomicrobiota bacterium]
TLASLVEYIAHFANELFEGDTARCRLDLPNDLPALPLPPEMRHDIFLVVKEALTNVLRHASAKEVFVQTRIHGRMLEILVRDDGRGFDLVAPPPALHNGLENMRRRAATIGGTLAMTGAPGQGTTVRLTVKLPAAGNAG